MPRPRRTKVASAAPRVVPSPPPNSTSNIDTKSRDGEMPLQKRGRGRPPKKVATEKVAPAEEEPTPFEHEPVPKPNVRPRGRPAIKKTIASEGQNRALNALRQRRDAALQAKSSKQSSAVITATTPVRKSNAFQSLQQTSSTPIQSRKERGATPAATLAPPSAQRARSSSLQRDTDEELYGLSPGGKASKLRIESRRPSIQHAPPSALKAQGTPAVETSVLALANFKRRPRQPSLIRMVQQTSELGHEEDDPILRGLEDTLDDFGDFNPEDESTPLNLNKRRSNVESALRSASDEAHTSSLRKRKHIEVDEDIQVLRSSPPINSSPPPVERDHSLSRSSSTSSLPDVVLSTQKSQGLPEVGTYSDVMAPPQSSSEAESPVRLPTRPDKRRKICRDKQNHDQAAENAQSPARARRTKPRKRAQTISTAALQSLLPKPRLKPRAAKHGDAYDFPSSDPLGFDDSGLTLQDEEDDELARPKKGRSSMKTPMRKVSGNRQAGGKVKKSTAVDSPASGRRVTTNSATTLSAKGKGKEAEKVKKTYGRARALTLEKENDQSVVIPSDHSSDEDEHTETNATDGIGKKGVGGVAAKVSKTKELEQARKKFAEVDEWEMEFESVDLGGGGSSSPWR